MAAIRNLTIDELTSRILSLASLNIEMLEFTNNDLDNKAELIKLRDLYIKRIKLMIDKMTSMSVDNIAYKPLLYENYILLNTFEFLTDFDEIIQNPNENAIQDDIERVSELNHNMEMEINIFNKIKQYNTDQKTEQKEEEKKVIGGDYADSTMILAIKNNNYLEHVAYGYLKKSILDQLFLVQDGEQTKIDTILANEPFGVDQVKYRSALVWNALRFSGYNVSPIWYRYTDKFGQEINSLKKTAQELANISGWSENAIKLLTKSDKFVKSKYSIIPFWNSGLFYRVICIIICIIVLILVFYYSVILVKNKI